MSIVQQIRKSSLGVHAIGEIDRMGKPHKMASLFLQKFCDKDPRTAKMFYESIGNPQRGALFYKRQDRTRQESIGYLAKKCIVYCYENSDVENAKILLNLPICGERQKSIGETLDVMEWFFREWNSVEGAVFVRMRSDMRVYSSGAMEVDGKYYYTEYVGTENLNSMDRAEAYLKIDANEFERRIVHKIRGFFASESEKLVEKFDKYLHPKDGLFDGIIRFKRESVLARLVKTYIVHTNAQNRLTGEDAHDMRYLQIKKAKKLSDYADGMIGGKNLKGSIYPSEKKESDAKNYIPTNTNLVETLID